MVVHTAEKEQIKYFAQNKLDKITFFYVQTVYSSLWSLTKHFSPFKELQGLEMYYTMNDHRIR